MTRKRKIHKRGGGGRKGPHNMRIKEGGGYSNFIKGRHETKPGFGVREADRREGF